MRRTAVSDGPKPLTRQRSPWIEDGDAQVVPGIASKQYRRNTSDGVLFAFVDELPTGWHMSISFRDKRGRHTRYPSWDEITHARYELLPGDLSFAMILPPKDNYLAVHPTTFHLHERPERRP
jgi:hypothetical protein